ncbi:MAG: hypothetical protein OEY28_02855 [Nitrospira sp.]|nr:hypothetical protein [Nitrospira sp.]
MPRPTDEERGTTAISRGLAPDPRLVRRCREYQMKRVPASYAEFEMEILRWIATCVTSRTTDAHRELPLVRGNKSLERLWQQLTPGQSVRIIPKYTWGPYRVESVEFSSPDVRGAAPFATEPSQQTTGEAPPAKTADPPQTRTKPPGPSEPRRPDGPREIVEPSFPDDIRDILDDARKLAEWLRQQGEHAAARRLELLIRKGAKLLIGMMLLVGAYYLASKYIAGRLLFQWGWMAAGPHFQRSLARLTSLLPGMEDTLGSIVKIAKQHPRFAGAGIKWKVLHEIVDGTVLAQIDDAACGPACLEMVLGDRGINISHADIVDRARRLAPMSNNFVALDVVVTLLNDFDPGAWVGGELGLPGANQEALVRILNGTGTWIAFVNKHFVVVDGIDSKGRILVRDPWYEPGIQRGIRAGSRYTVSWKTFSESWRSVGIFRQGR